MKDDDKKASADFSAAGFLWRFLACFALVMLTFNPSGYSAYHWIGSSIGAGSFGPLHAVVIILLVIGWAVVWVATWRALDTFGVLLASLALAAIVWLLADLGLLATGSVSSMTWIVLVCLSAVLTIGMTWAHVWRRLTGQYSVDQVDD